MPTIRGFSTKDPEKMKEIMQHLPFKPAPPVKPPLAKRVEPSDKRCTATTKAGNRCKKDKVGKSKFCELHK